MYLSKIRIEDYKSFRDSGEIEFKPGINIIVGQNNSGKTALLEALSLKFENKPHRSQNRVSTRNLWQDSRKRKVEDERRSKVKGIVTILPQEIWELKNEIFYVPYLCKKEGENGYSSSPIEEYQERLQIPLEVQFTHNGASFLNQKVVDFGYTPRNDAIPMGIKIIGNNKLEFEGRNDKESLITERFCRTFPDEIYRFKAERLCSESSVLGFMSTLDSDASNLPAVINWVQSNDIDNYQLLNKLVSTVIPSISTISSARKKESNKPTGDWAEIKVWTSDKTVKNQELSFSLDECGTGVGQVIAILYVLVTSRETSKTILIDEPNSFLHPLASQKLIQILNDFPEHQYIISTHSPEIVTASKPSTITMLNYVDGETKIEQIDLSSAKGVKKVFVDLGIKPSTFAFANNILWVEGSTEVKAFSKILEHANINNVVIKPTVPSEFRQNKKRFENVRHIFKLHEEISGTNSVVSPKMTILLDKEIGKEQENTDLIREFGEDKFNFLPRAMYENYLLDSEAITFVLNFTKETDDFNDTPSEDKISNKKISSKKVEKFIEDAKNNKDFLLDELKNKELTENEWLEKVDGAKLLDNLFKEFLGKPFGYAPHKVEYGEKLTEWLLENKPEQLEELKEFLLKILSTKNFS